MNLEQQLNRILLEGFGSPDQYAKKGDTHPTESLIEMGYELKPASWMDEPGTRTYIKKHTNGTHEIARDDSGRITDTFGNLPAIEKPKIEPHPLDSEPGTLVTSKPAGGAFGQSKAIYHLGNGKHVEVLHTPRSTDQESVTLSYYDIDGKMTSDKIFEGSNSLARAIQYLAQAHNIKHSEPTETFDTKPYGD